MHVLSLWMPSFPGAEIVGVLTLQGAEIVGADFARWRVCGCRVCEVTECPVFIGHTHVQNPIAIRNILLFTFMHLGPIS